jgi:paired amphipathic helix protein Sin3a
MLNDKWVSVPTGSEDSFTFKNIQRNICEEALFKVEDDRFEVDMVIESTLSAIRTLEPIDEELKRLKASKDPIAASYKLDHNLLKVIHLKAIARIYGEQGGDMLELLYKSPTSAIPIMLKRLRQKIMEWRQQKLEMNVEWKGLLQANYFRSLDHRSLYFPSQDKKATSSRQLFAEVMIFIFKYAT